MKHTNVLLVLVVVGCGSSDGKGSPGDENNTASNAAANNSASNVPVGECELDRPEHAGEGTYYDADGTGACGFAPAPDLMVAALNPVDFADSAACGGCITVDGPDGSVTVRVVDLCPECPEGDVDLSREAFERIAPLPQGRVPISWRAAPCDVSGPVVYHFKDGSNEWWTALQMRNTRHAIARFEYQTDDGSFQAVERLAYNYFVEDSGMGPGPYTFRVTDVTGQVLEDSGVAFIEDGDRIGSAQFGLCGSR